MGNHQEYLEEDTTQVTMKIFLLLSASILSILSAPQYGNIGGQSEPQCAPASVRCRTEQVTIWDTTYVETQENICTTLYVNQCQTLYERLTTRRNATNSSERNTNPTQRQSAAPAIRRTASTTGKELEMTRNGFRTDPPAKTTHTSTARTWRSSTRDKSPTQSVIRSRSRTASTSL